MLTRTRRSLNGVLLLSLLAGRTVLPAQTLVSARSRSTSQTGTNQASGAQGANANAGSGGVSGDNGAQGEAPLPSSFKNVFWQPNDILEGSVTFLTVEMSRPASRVSGRLLGKEIAFFRGDKPTVWYALAGVDVETAPGTYDLGISAVI